MGKNINDAIHSIPIRGPGDKLRIRLIPNPDIDSITPMIEERIIATQRLGDWFNPSNAGADNNPITKITPTDEIELTITKDVVKPRIKFKEDTFIPE